jgi:nucleotide-binding universal stress UspA family protein
MILLCYDGSDHAKAAADRAAKLFPRAPVTVLTVWEPFVQVMAETATGGGFMPPMGEDEAVDRALRDRATETADEGVDRVRDAGMVPEPRVEMRGLSVAATVLEVADEVGADAIVMGTRGLGAFKSAILGSVSQGVLRHGHRPVVAVPSD